MEATAPPDVVGLAPADAATLLTAAGWRVTCRTTAWDGPTPGGIGRRLTEPRVIAVRTDGRLVELLVAGFPQGPLATNDSGRGEGA